MSEKLQAEGSVAHRTGRRCRRSGSVVRPLHPPRTRGLRKKAKPRRRFVFAGVMYFGQAGIPRLFASANHVLIPARNSHTSPDVGRRKLLAAGSSPIFSNISINQLGPCPVAPSWLSQDSNSPRRTTKRPYCASLSKRLLAASRSVSGSMSIPPSRFMSLPVASHFCFTALRSVPSDRCSSSGMNPLPKKSVHTEPPSFRTSTSTIPAAGIPSSRSGRITVRTVCLF